MNIYEKLLNIQCELKAPKSQYNKFGNYSYRNCEDILEAVKPICKKYNAVLFVSDEIINIDNRFYVEATATLVNVEEPTESITVNASARESESKKGMDDSQVTGATSSYARKYALNGLFDIDDTKDADSDEPPKQKTTKKPEQKQVEAPKITEGTKKQIQILAGQFAEAKNKKPLDVYNALQEKFNYTDINTLKETDGQAIIKVLINWNRQSQKETTRTR